MAVASPSRQSELEKHQKHGGPADLPGRLVSPPSGHIYSCIFHEAESAKCPSLFYNEF